MFPKTKMWVNLYDKHPSVCLQEATANMHLTTPKQLRRISPIPVSHYRPSMKAAKWFSGAADNLLAPAKTWASHCSYCGKMGQKGRAERSLCSCAYRTTLHNTSKFQQPSRRSQDIKELWGIQTGLLIFRHPDSGSIHLDKSRHFVCAWIPVTDSAFTQVEELKWREEIGSDRKMFPDRKSWLEVPNVSDKRSETVANIAVTATNLKNQMCHFMNPFSPGDKCGAANSIVRAKMQKQKEALIVFFVFLLWQYRQIKA